MFIYRKLQRVIFCTGICVVFYVSLLLAAPIADHSSKFLGNITNGTPQSNFGDYWNQITLENGGKWGSVQPNNQNSFNWSQTDAAYKYCKSKGWPFKHHCFVWGQQQPGWVNDRNAQAAVENYIKTYGQLYPETEFIDVVNEPLHAPAGYRSGLGGNGTTGWDWVVTVFEYARKYCPKSKLLINDYGIVNDMNAAKRYLAIIKILQSKNLIDGIGVQSHCFNLESTTAANVKRVLDTLATSGLPIYSSEFDLTGNETTQLNRYKTFFPVFWEHKAVKGVTLWGYTNNWKGGVIMSGTREYAALKWLRTYVDSIEAATGVPEKSKYTRSVSGQSVLIGQNAIRMYVATPDNVTLTIFNSNGRMLQKNGSQMLTPGEHYLRWSESLPQGAYVVMIKGDQINQIHKFIR